MTEPQPIRVSFRYSDLPRRPLGASFRAYPRALAFLANALLGLATVLPVAAVIDALTSPPLTLGQVDTLFFPGLAVGLVCGLLLLALFDRLGKIAQARAHDAFARGPSRKGGTDVILDASGVVATGKGSLWQLSWTAIVSVEELDDFTLLRPSEVEYLPIPHASLPPGVIPEDLRRAIAHWRAA